MSDPKHISEVLAEWMKDDPDPWHCQWCVEPVSDEPCSIHQKPLFDAEPKHRGTARDELDHNGHVPRNP